MGLKREKSFLVILTSLIIAAVVFTCIIIHLKTGNKSGSDTNGNYEVVTAEQFGANGYDDQLDTVAIQKAINSSHSIILKSGATYLIDEPLVSKRSIKIKTDGSQPAVILQKSQKSAFIFDHKPVMSTNVTQPIASKQNFLFLKSTKGIHSGDLLHLVSNKLWYWDDRGYLKKGGLYKVIKVEGNKVILDSPVMENYFVGNGEFVSAAIYSNSSVQLDNITFIHPRPYNTVMLRLNYTSNAKLEGISIKNSKRIGILLTNTFHTVVRHANVDLGTTEDINTGYGIQDFGGERTLITESVFSRVRRGVDFSGVTPSRNGIVMNSKAIGYPKGVLASGNSGFGTHSTAEYITFKNNYVQNFNYAFLVRGNHIKVENNTLKGLSSSFIAISYGNHVKVYNNTYQKIGNSELHSFILVPSTYNGMIDAQGNKVNALAGPFIKGNIDQLQSLLMRGNTVGSQ